MENKSDSIKVNANNPVNQLVPFKMDDTNYNIWSK